MSGSVEIAKRIDQPKRVFAYTDEPELGFPLDFSRRIPELDGLRGIAIGMVIFFHVVTLAIAARPTLPLGYILATTRLFWSGVDLFFVLSGFLIGGILLDARDSPNYFKTFYVRRFCRILPLYFLFIGLVATAYQFVYRPIGAPLNGIFEGRLPWYWYFSFAQNLRMAKLNTTGAAIMSVTWSLAVEEQFYLVLPAIVRFVRRSALPYVFIAGIVIAPLVRLFIIFRFPTSFVATYALLPCRMDTLFVGALCAYGLREPRVWRWLVKSRTAVWTGFFVLLAGMAGLNASMNASSGVPFLLSMLSLGYGWMAVFYATAISLALTESASFFSRAMRWRMLTGLGTIAYSVYLFHLGIYGLCFWFLRHGWPLTSWKDFEVTLFGLAVTVAFGELLWRYFERPIVRWGHHWEY
jgi:peptidoglycan/LPS O-acetylase OafA/YrhL